MIAILLLTVVALLMIFGAAWDVYSFTIPNWISIAVAALFLPAALLAGIGWAGFGLHMATGFGVLLIGMGMFAMRWVGGGDAKLLAATALWMGWPDIMPYAALMAVLGGLFTLLLLGARQTLGPVAQGFGLNLPILQRTRDIPYGVAIAVGALMFLPQASVGAALLSAAI